MNRLRIRMEGAVREYPLTEEESHCLECVTLALKRRLNLAYGLTTETLTYIGDGAWNIYVETVKVGHAKAFDRGTPKHDSSNPTLFQWILLIVSCYLALC
jgi:hypothetical protein